MKLAVHATSDVGLQRNHNEDMALLGTRILRDERYDGVHEISPQGRPYVMAVADGLGGQAAGEVASREVLVSFRDEVAALDGGLSPAALCLRLAEIASGIQNGLLARGRANPRHRGMATTLTAVILYDQQFFLAHAGDSRCYLLRNGLLRQVSRDHTLREFSGDPRIPGNILANCFGSEADFFLDAQPFGGEFEPGDVFVLCSDGLSDMVSDEVIEQTLRDFEDLHAAGTRLLELAHVGGGRDNITFILARRL
ncbi:MAG: PP2C family protein-serine/threonine phosphatase [Spirochaetaceae bacterium]